MCPELNNEAVDYDEPSGNTADDGEALCVILAVDTQMSQQQMVPLKEALLEVSLFVALPCPLPAPMLTSRHNSLADTCCHPIKSGKLSILI